MVNRVLPAFVASTILLLHAQTTPDWEKINAETMRHFDALIQIDSTDPPGNETRVAEYVKKVFDAAGIPNIIAAKDPARANIIARLKGSGSKRPLLIVGHSDTVKVDPAKWIYPPFSATHHDGHVYGRGARDDKSNLVAAMMTMLTLKRLQVQLDRDVIFLSEAGEEADTAPGIEYVINQHWDDIDAEVCIAEGGVFHRNGGKLTYAAIQTTEKQPKGASLIAKGPSGHGSRPLQSNAILHLARAVDKVATWDPPMRFNDTTRTYFEKLANISSSEDAARYKALFDPQKAASVRAYFAANDPLTYSMLHTSISPNVIQGGFQVNVVPSSAEATLDIRALPDEDMPEFYALMAKVINDPAVEVVPSTRNQRPGATPSPIDSEAYRAIENAIAKVYRMPALPMMSTGATDMAFLRAKGVHCYGVAAMADDEDTAKGFAMHSDQERILDEAVYKHVRFFWEAVTAIAGQAGTQSP
jgi:acetylornithine deacetylase/succinyl-diaminopimelate desuccinylase-like protein